MGDKEIRIKYFRNRYKNFTYKIKNNTLATAEQITLYPSELNMVSLGISMEIPEGYTLIIKPVISVMRKYQCIIINELTKKYEDKILHIPLMYIAKDIVGLKYITIPANTEICSFELVRIRYTYDNIEEIEE